MAILQSKETNFKIENALSCGDHTNDEVQTKVNTRRSMESKIAGDGDGKINSTNANIDQDASDAESAYDDSFCSDMSEDESAITGVSHRSSVTRIPSMQPASPKMLLKRKDLINSSKKFVSSPKIWDEPLLTLESRAKSLSLSEVRPNRSMNFRTTRKNMSFTNDEIMKIERDNEILLRKIMAQQQPPKQKMQSSQPKLSSSAINRMKLQRKIEEDNLMLVRRLQQAKSCVINSNKLSGYRATQF